MQSDTRVHEHHNNCVGIMIGFNEKNIFLFDGIGAIVSVIILAVILPAIQPVIGMPMHILYSLAIIPAIFAPYSLSCFLWIDHRNRNWLKAIICGNSFYCVLTLSLLVLYRKEITSWGILYFICEALVLAVLIWLEKNIAYPSAPNFSEESPS